MFAYILKLIYFWISAATPSSVTETQNAFAPKNKTTSTNYKKSTSQLYSASRNNGSVEAHSQSRGSSKIFAGVTRFRADPSYDSNLGDVAELGRDNGVPSTLIRQSSLANFPRNSSRKLVPVPSAHQSQKIIHVGGRSTTLSYAPMRGMVSQSQNQLSLMEQKKRQWAQERG